MLKIVVKILKFFAALLIIIS